MINNATKMPRNIKKDEKSKSKGYLQDKKSLCRILLLQWRRDLRVDGIKTANLVYLSSLYRPYLICKMVWFNWLSTSNAREFAWKLRWAEIKSINSVVKLTLDCSSACELMVP